MLTEKNKHNIYHSRLNARQIYQVPSTLMSIQQRIACKYTCIDRIIQQIFVGGFLPACFDVFDVFVYFIENSALSSVIYESRLKDLTNSCMLYFKLHLYNSNYIHNMN